MAGRVAWPAVVRALPGPVGLAAWIAVTVVVPLVFYEATHRWEEDQDTYSALGWTVAAVPVLAATTAVRWIGRTNWPRSLSAAAAVGAFVSAVFLAGSMAFYRWIIPLGEVSDPSPVWLRSWAAVWWCGLLLSVVGAAIGGRAGLKRRSRSRRPTYLGGAIVAVAGALLAPVVVRLGAEDSTSWYDEGRYGGVGPYAAPAAGSGVLELPAAGRYAIMAVGFSPKDPACLVSGSGLTRQAELVAIPPEDYGGDAVSYAWVASFRVPGPGTYSLTCRSSDEQASYTVGAVPHIRGAVGALIHWPLVVIMLLGGLPGLLIIAAAAVRSLRESS